MAHSNTARPNHGANTDHRRIVLIVFFLGLIPRLILYIFSEPWKSEWVGRMLTSDSFEYFALGRSLFERGVFSYTWPEALPHALRLPVYPIFVALTSCGGVMSCIWITSLTQLVLDSVFAGSLVKIMGDLFSRRSIGIVSGCIYAVNPDAVFWSTQIMPETMSVWLMILTVYGLATIATYPSAPVRVIIGVCAGGMIPLVKPAWQYFLLGMLLWLLVHIVKSRSQSQRRMAVSALLLLCLPSGAWMLRNYHHWGIAMTSVNGPLAKTWAAKAILEGASKHEKVEIPNYSKEMSLHIGFIADHGEGDWVPSRFKSVYHWAPDGLRAELSASRHLLPSVLQDHLGLYLKSAAFGTSDVLFAPQNRHLKEFLGLSLEQDRHWKTMSGEHLNGWDEIEAFLASRLRSPATLFWTAYALSFLGLFYLACFLGVGDYAKRYIWSPWSIYILTVIPLVFLMGPLGQARYRLSMIQPLLPLAALGGLHLYNILKLKRAC
jgi:hypothetical protein